MRTVVWVALALAVAGCAEEGRYPLSRALAGPNDPVARMVVPPLPTVPLPG